MSVLYCECETPVMDVMHDAGCRRCGRPVNFAPERPGLELETHPPLKPGWTLKQSVHVQRGRFGLFYNETMLVGSYESPTQAREIHPEAFEHAAREAR